MPATKSQEIAADVTALLRARNPLLWVVTREEARAESHLIQAAAAAGYKARTWDVAQGITDLQGNRETIGGPDPADTLAVISDRAVSGSDDRCVWITRPAGVAGRRAWRFGASLTSQFGALASRHPARSCAGCHHSHPFNRSSTGTSGSCDRNRMAASGPRRDRRHFRRGARCIARRPTSERVAERHT